MDLVTSEVPRTLHGLRDVGNVSAPPQPDLVAEDPESTRPAAADGALGDDAPLHAAPVMDRRLLDDECPLWDFDLERGVIEVACAAVLQSSRHRLVDATVEPDELPTGAERQPVEVDGGLSSTRRSTTEPISAEGLHPREYRSGTAARPRSSRSLTELSCARLRTTLRGKRHAVDGGPVKTRPLQRVEALRAFGVMLGGPIALAAGATASVVAVARSLLAGHRPPPLALFGSAAAALYALVIRPWHLRWGTEPADETRELPGDDLLPEHATQILHAVTIDAPVEEVWPWLAQLGQDRGGFYSYEWLENLAGCEMRNADRIHPEWQHRELGETVHLHPAGGLRISVFQPGRALGLEGWGTFALEPFGTGQSRLFARGGMPRGLVAAAYGLLIEIPHFLMERRMLLGIKERAERSHGSGACAGVADKPLGPPLDS
jgi:hypothetical protein